MPKVMAQLRPFLAAVLATLILCAPLLSQERGTRLEGTAFDTQEAVIPELALWIATRGFKAKVKTDGNGRFHIDGLKPGKYKIRAIWTGYDCAHWKPIKGAQVIINPGQEVVQTKLVLVPTTHCE